ncbi:MAG: MFS transporter [Actinomycetia bacterium]|nr:MFS transporter [Actinomycetes bacterium]
MADISNATTSKPQGFFRGWWMVIGGFLIMATCYTIFVNCIPIFQSHMVADLRVNVSQFNLGVSLCTIMAIFASLLFGRLADKASIRLLSGITVIVSSLVLVLFSFVQEIWQFYVLCLVAGLIVVAGTRLLISVLTTNWFNLRRGLAISIALSGSGAGGVLLSPLISAMIVHYGWRPAFLLLAVICLACALPIALIFFRNRPSDVGLQPYGAGQSEQAVVDRSPDPNVDIAIGWKILGKNAGFWVMILGFIMMGVINGAIITNSVTNMTSVTLGDQVIITGGHDAIWAGNVWSLYLGVVIVAKISLGAIYDRFGLRAGTILGTVTCVIAAIALCFPTTDFGPIIAAVAFGFGTCMGTVTPPVMAVKLYGKKDIGLITGVLTAFQLLGAAGGAVLSGLLFDHFHTFVPAWIMALIAALLMGLALLVAIPIAHHLVEHCRECGALLLDEDGREIPATPAPAPPVAADDGQV